MTDDPTIVFDPGLTVREARALARTASLLLSTLRAEDLELWANPALEMAQRKLEIALMVTGVEI